MNRPLRGAGRIVLISDITRSDRPKLPDFVPSDDDARGGMVVATLALVALAACVALVAYGVWVLA